MFGSVWQVGNDPFVILASLLLVPVIWVWLSRAHFTSLSNRWLAISAAVLYGFFTAYFFPWSLFSVYLRWAPLLALAAASWIAFRHPLAALLKPKIIIRRRLWLIFCLALAILLDASIVKGMFPWSKAVDLAFPMKGGTYTIAQGGSSFWLNYHYGMKGGFRYAVDILQVDAFGRRASGLLPESMDAYRIYGERVYSPCGGQVVTVVDGLKDSPVFTKDADEAGGNQISIDCSGVLVQLEHLLFDTINVAEGQFVSVGEPIARVGSTGASSEPHLHIQANEYENGIIAGSLPVTFEGRYLVRNALTRP